ncbi:MAG TPA: DUF438 domain-containing protein [Firmicutes bacterium]|nr:DUF438 domain-containing protein [Bacillota bacterium]
MSRIKELARTLKGINEGTVSNDEARRILSGIDPVELSLAEQELLKEGVAPQELRRLCDAHLRVVEKEVDDLKARTGEGHPLHTLISEHELILGFLDSLESIVGRLARGNSRGTSSRDAHAVEREDMARIKSIAEHLVETEKHHQREEEALFPAMEHCGITGPTMIMRLEHEEMRPKKKELLALAEAALAGTALDEALAQAPGDLGSGEFTRRLREVTAFIVFHLREHIFKENAILYPAAFKAITEPEVWDEIRKKCDAIGYCCFTPILSGGPQAQGPPVQDKPLAHAC